MTTDTTTQGITPDLARRELLLAVADDDLVSGHRASAWTGVAPSIEEDLAFSTIAQDQINHADLWYQVLLTSSDGSAPRSEVDRLGLGRAPAEYRHAVCCERPHQDDFGIALARHWCHDHADALRLGSLAASGDADVAAVATRLLHEERYHLEHADLWFRRLVAAGDDVAARWRGTLADELVAATWLFEPTIGEDVALATGLLDEPAAAVFARWAEVVTTALDHVGWGDVVPAAVRAGDAQGLFTRPGGRHGVHTDDFVEDVWPEMTALHRAHPGASW